MSLGCSEDSRKSDVWTDRSLNIQSHSKQEAVEATLARGLVDTGGAAHHRCCSGLSPLSSLALCSWHQARRNVARRASAVWRGVAPGPGSIISHSTVKTLAAAYIKIY